MKITQAPMMSNAVIAGCCDCATCAAAPIHPVGGGPGCPDSCIPTPMSR
jgi:hypothetical protein